MYVSNLKLFSQIQFCKYMDIKNQCQVISFFEFFVCRSTSKYFVRMFYRNDTSQPDRAYGLSIPGCVNDCPLDSFIA